eukprot:m.16827 g.16827  ORF g.16827 m.16827 type:complete len:268 (+) comp6987_c0_seq2:1046-1849(+)
MIAGSEKQVAEHTHSTHNDGSGQRGGEESDAGLTPLMAAAFHGDLAALRKLAPEADVDEAMPTNRYTALMFAAVSGHVGAVRELLRWGADRSSQCRRGRTALDLARMANSPACIALLQNYVPFALLEQFLDIALPNEMRLQPHEPLMLFEALNGDSFLAPVLHTAFTLNDLACPRIAEVLEVAAGVVARAAFNCPLVLRLLYAAQIARAAARPEIAAVVGSIGVLQRSGQEAEWACTRLAALANRLNEGGEDPSAALDNILRGTDLF